MKTSSTQHNRILPIRLIPGSAFGVALFFTTFAVCPAQDATRSWGSSDGGNFGVNTNWMDSTPPGTDDLAVFDLSGEDFTVDFEGISPSTQQLQVRNGEVIFDLRGETYTVTDDRSGNNSSVIIGRFDGNDASLEILDGTMVTEQVRIGGVEGAKGHLTIGEDGIWQPSGDFNVGINEGQGSLLIEDGGKVTSTSRIFIGRLDGVGEVLVTGADSELATTASGNLAFGTGTAGAGTAQLTIAEGATASTGGDAFIGRDESTGTLIVTGTDIATGLGSAFHASGDIFVGGDSSGSGGTGTVQVNDGGVATVGGLLRIWDDGGTLTGNGTIVGNVQNDGVVSPGNSTGTLLIEGDFTQTPTGLMDIELGGTAAGLFDVLHVEDNVSLAGSLDLSLVDNFDLDFNQFFQTLVVEGTFSGQFDGITEGASVGSFGGFDLFITYDPQATFGTAHGGFGLYTIPEPSTAWLMGIAAAWLLIRRRNFRVRYL